MTADRSRAARGRFVAAIVGIVSLTLWTYRDVLSYWFTGVDALPLILSSRVSSITEIPALLVREHLGAFSGEEIAGAIGVRPVASLSFAADYWMWGLNPFGYHLTNLLIHCANAVLVFVLAQHLRLSRPLLVGLCAAVLFAIHPLHARTVTVIPVRFDLLLCTFALLSLIMAIRYVNLRTRGSLILCLVFGALALGAKETGVAIVPVILISAALFLTDTRRPLKTLWPLATGLAAVLCGYLIYRGWVVKGVGGYALREIGSLQSVTVVTRKFFGLLLYPLPFMDSSPWSQVASKGLIGIVAAALVLTVSVGTPLFLFGASARRLAAPDDRRGADRRAAVVVALWLVGFFAFYLAIYKATGIVQHWYLYLPSAMYSILIAMAMTSAGAEFWKAVTAVRRSSAVITRNFAIAFLAIAIPTASFVRSPLFGYLGDWAAGSRMARQYLEAAASSIRTLPDNGVVFLVNLPHGLSCGYAPCVAPTTIFEDYSVASWVTLVNPGKHMTFVAASTIWPESSTQAIEPRVSYDAAHRQLIVQNVGGCLESPWRTRSGHYFTTEFDNSADCAKRSRFTLTAELPEDDGYYFFDFFDRGRIYAIRDHELVFLEHR